MIATVRQYVPINSSNVEEQQYKLKVILYERIRTNDKDKNLCLPEAKLDLDEINHNQIIFKFDFKKIKISKTFNKRTKNKNNHTRALESKNKNNFKIKKNKDRKRLDPNNPFATLASLLKDNKDKFN